MSNPLIDSAVRDAKLMENPLLSGMFKMPGRIFPLPSRAYFYTAGKEITNEVKMNNGEIHVRPMSAMAELKLKNPDLLFSGKGIEEVIRECVPDILDPLALAAIDVDAILVYLRVVTYGDTYELDAMHTCEGAKVHSYDVSLEQQIANTVFLDEDALSKMRLTKFQVAVTGREYDIILEPIRMAGLIQYYQLGRKDPAEIEHKDYQDLIVSNLVHFIKSVDQLTDRRLIVEFLHALTRPELEKIQDVISNSMEFGIPLTRRVECPDCHAAHDVKIDINPTLFF